MWLSSTPESIKGAREKFATLDRLATSERGKRILPAVEVFLCDVAACLRQGRLGTMMWNTAAWLHLCNSVDRLFVRHADRVATSA